MSLYFTRLIPRAAIWGGSTLRDYFSLSDEIGDDVGQAWAFSGQAELPSILKGGEYDGRTLLDLWNEKPSVFNSRYDVFPYIISLVAPEADLSIQVHPNTAFARPLGYSNGKNEAWVFLKAPTNGSIVYGHNAHDKSDLMSYVNSRNWNGLVKRLPVRKDDIVYIPAGTMHALNSGSVVYEVQQSTDITYRFYDYDRRDAHGNMRPLQLANAIDCLGYDTCSETKPSPQSITHHGYTETVLCRNHSFTIRRVECHDACKMRFTGYQLATVTSGFGRIQDVPVQKGASFLLPAGEMAHVEGHITLLTTSEE